MRPAALATRAQVGQSAPVSLKSEIWQNLAPIVDFIYPPRCPACGEGIGAQTGLCASCWSNLEIPGTPQCSTCQLPLPEYHAVDDETLCEDCSYRLPQHDGIVAGSIYNDVSRKLVLGFKHGRKIALSGLLSNLILANLPDSPVPRLIVPVPLHRWRLWQRGYNQAALLAKDMAKAGAGTLLVDGLMRSKPTPSLGHLSSRARRDALSGAIAINKKAQQHSIRCQYPAGRRCVDQRCDER